MGQGGGGCRVQGFGVSGVPGGGGGRDQGGSGSGGSRGGLVFDVGHRVSRCHSIDLLPSIWLPHFKS